jgi:Helix-turn-helix domain
MPRRKIFGYIGQPLDREAKVRLMHRARCLSRRMAPRRHYGSVTGKALSVLESLLWGFLNGRDGRCFPSYELIAEAAGCSRAMVARAIRMLEDAGLLTWCTRLRRVREDGRVRVLRTSNSYAFPGGSQTGFVALRNRVATESKFPTGTPIKDLSLPLSEALDRLQGGIRRGQAGPSAPNDATSRAL